MLCCDAAQTGDKGESEYCGQRHNHRAQSNGQIWASYNSDTHLGCVESVCMADSCSLCECESRQKKFKRQKCTQERTGEEKV